MKDLAHKKQGQQKLARIEIVSQLYKRGYSVRRIREEVMKRLGLKSYSVSTVQSDIRSLLDEWRENRLEDMDDALQLELTRIDDTIRELWEQWEKSKVDQTLTGRKRKGAPSKKKMMDSKGDITESENISTTSIEESIRNVIRLGNPSYIAEIRQQLIERRKLLGLYAPEKKEFSGKVTNITQMSDEELIAEIERLEKIGD